MLKLGHNQIAKSPVECTDDLAIGGRKEKGFSKFRRLGSLSYPSDQWCHPNQKRCELLEKTNQKISFSVISFLCV